MRRLRRFAWVAAIIAAAFAVALGVAVRMLDTPAARAALERRLSEATNGQVAWDSLELRLLPRPRGVLHGVLADMPGVNLRAARIEAVLSLAPLLRGRAEVASILLVQPQVRLEPLGAAPASAGKEEKKTDPFAVLQAFAADTVLRVEDGAFEMKVPDGPFIALRGLALRARSTGDAAHIDLADAAGELVLEGLPGPLMIRGGSITLTPGRADFDALAVAMLDATMRASGTASGYRESRLQVEASAAGDIGPQIAHWAVARAGEAQLEPATPLRFTVTQLRWGPDKALQAAGQVQGERGPQLTVELGWTPQVLDVRRLVIKDARSDAVLSARVEAQRVQWGFSGSLEAESLSTLLKSTAPGTGRMSGDWKVTVDRREPRRSTAEGKLRAEKFDLEWLVRRPLRVVRLDLNVEGKTLNLGELSVESAGQSASLRGQVRLGGPVPLLDARLESPGIDVDKLLEARPAANKGAEETQETAPGKKPAPAATSKLWPLPVNGTVAVNAGFVRYAGREAAPVAGTLKLEPRRAALELTETRLCEVGFPLAAEAVPGRISARTTISLKKQPVDEAVHCLTSAATELSGTATLRAELATEGASTDELLRNLSGGVEGEIVKGTVGKMTLLGRILALRSFADSADLSKYGGEAQGLPFRRIAAKGRLRNGQFLLEESVLDGEAVRLAATGEIGLVAPDINLTVMVAPLAGVDRAVGAIPIIGRVLGGALTAVPVGVTGDIRDPRVVPLGPGAITKDLLGVFQRALKVPLKLAEPVAAEKEEK